MRKITFTLPLFDDVDFFDARDRTHGVFGKWRGVIGATVCPNFFGRSTAEAHRAAKQEAFALLLEKLRKMEDPT